MEKIQVCKGYIDFSNGMRVKIDALGFYVSDNFDKFQVLLGLIETLYILDKLHGSIPIFFPSFHLLEGCEPCEFKVDYLNKLSEIDLEKYRLIVQDQIKRLEETSKIFLLERMPWTRHDDVMRRRIGYIRRLAIYITPKDDKETEFLNE